jgi:hypothetical protein
MDYRTLAAGVLGVGLGVVLFAYPEAIVRAQLSGRLPQDRRGEYGADAELPATWRGLVRAVGVAVAAGGVYFGVTALGW